MGDIDKGKEYLGITGKWKADKTSIILKINTSQSCKVKEGQEIKASYIMNGKQEFEISESGSNQKPTIFRRQNQSGVDERK
ncbi:MAG: hypothetical protein HZA50_19575 [Planctomycetes bacterium]|nr:hypothetical protein [Planctomycetota bacterium]